MNLKSTILENRCTFNECITILQNRKLFMNLKSTILENRCTLNTK
jgi:hypothetical protein